MYILHSTFRFTRYAVRIYFTRYAYILHADTHDGTHTYISHNTDTHFTRCVLTILWFSMFWVLRVCKAYTANMHDILTDHSRPLMDDRLAAQERRMEQTSMRARARHLNEIAKACIFASSFARFVATQGPPTDIGGWGDPGASHQTGSMTSVVVCLVGMLFGSPMGGVLLDCAGWPVAVGVSSLALFLGNALLLSANSLDGAQAGSYHSRHHLIQYVGVAIASAGAGAMVPIACVLALARENGGSVAQYRVAKTFAMSAIGVCLAAFSTEVWCMLSRSGDDPHATPDPLLPAAT